MSEAGRNRFRFMSNQIKGKTYQRRLLIEILINIQVFLEKLQEKFYERLKFWQTIFVAKRRFRLNYLVFVVKTDSKVMTLSILKTKKNSCERLNVF